jgi:chaperone required for assembly of F1-ATPase
VSKIGDNPPALPKCFYKRASLGDDGAILLDGKPARTRARLALAAPPALAAAIVDEWNAQIDVIDFLSMPMTRFQMTVIDRGKADADAWRETTLSFLRSDLLCYRASEPAELVTRQSAEWDPLLRWAQGVGVSLKISSGVGFIEQSGVAIDAGAALLREAPPTQLLPIKAAAEISGSAVIALALWRRAFEAQTLFRASRVDEDFQAEKWGWDAVAEARARRLQIDFLNAARYSSLAAGSD